MCTYSMVVDSILKQPWAPQPEAWPGASPFPPSITITTPPNPIEKLSDDAIKALEKLLEAAREFDKKSGQPDCEDPAKVDALKALDARLADIDKRLKSVERSKRSQRRNLAKQAAKRKRARKAGK